jgi:site-specific DNA-cytosine methylase
MELGGNIKKITESILSHLPKLKKNDKVHVHASPPCQQLSIANTKKNEEDGLKMVKWVIKFVRQLYFDSYTIEQVNNKHVRDLYTKLKVPFILCDFSKLGVCQSRRRLIASDNLTLLERLYNTNIPFTPFHKILRKSISKLSQSFNKKETIRDYNPKEPYYTVICQQHRYIIYLKNNTRLILSPEISKTLQGFPQNYFKTNTSKQEISTMIGNAVPCQVGFVICTILQKI